MRTCWARCTPQPRQACRPTPTAATTARGFGIHTPIKQPDGNQTLSPDNRTYNRLLRALRCLGERGFALVKGRWRILQHITLSPSAIGDIARAALVLTHFERNYLPAIR